MEREKASIMQMLWSRLASSVNLQTFFYPFDVVLGRDGVIVFYGPFLGRLLPVLTMISAQLLAYGNLNLSAHSSCSLLSPCNG
jgi:hypothetical protein